MSLTFQTTALLFQATRLTRQTKQSALDILNVLQRGGGHITIDVVDDNGEVGHTCVYLDQKGALRAREKCPDPRNLFNKLKRSLGLKKLTLAVAPTVDPCDGL